MSQSRAMSFVESLANVAIGYVVALLAQLAIFPLFGIHVSLGENLLIGALFTIVSIARSYALRRMFNRLHRTSRPWPHNPNQRPFPAEEDPASLR